MEIAVKPVAEWQQQISTSLAGGRCGRRMVRAMVACLLVCLLFCSFSMALGESGDEDYLATIMDDADSRHLLTRVGFGTNLHELQQLDGMTRLAAIEQVMQGLAKPDQAPMPAWVHKPTPPYWRLQDMQQGKRNQFNQARNAELEQLTEWWLARMLASTTPQHERLTLFWHDHFATSYADLNHRSLVMARQQQTFRQHASGNYREFLQAMVRDPALLLFLDNDNSKKQAPNENLARELLELFTLGEGNYDEATIREAARALTGYGVAPQHDGRFRMKGWIRDENNKTLFGVTANHSGDTLVNIILQQPAAARHLATRFWHAFVSDVPPQADVIEQWADTFRQSDYDIATLYRTMLQSKAFWTTTHRASIVRSPVQLMVGVAHSIEPLQTQWQALPDYLRDQGMTLFSPPNVSGWQEGLAFTTAGRLLSRKDALNEMMENAALAAPLSGNEDGMMMSDNNMASADPTIADPTMMYEQPGMAMNSTSQSTDVADDAPYTADGVYVLWGNQGTKARRFNVAFLLDSVQTPHQRYENIAFRLHARDSRPVELRIESFDCFPICFDPWPDCSWRDDRYPESRTLVFSQKRSRRGLACHYESINEAGKALVSTLWNSMPDLLEQARTRKKGQRFARSIDKLHMLIEKTREQHGRYVYVHSDDEFVIDAAGRQNAAYSSAMAAAPSPTSAHFDDWFARLQTSEKNAFDVLLPGLPVTAFRQLAEFELATPGEQLDALLRHPALHVQ